MIITMLENEYWYGGCVSDGISQPVGPEDDRILQVENNPTPNQVMPLFVSSKGRLLWRDNGFRVHFCKGVIHCPDDVRLESGYESLRGAYIHAMKHYFPFKEIQLSSTLFDKPIFNSWIELTFNQNEADLLNYADKIIQNGFEPGVLMIDDGWSENYGNWTFHSGKFPNPQTLLQKLHDYGFEVMVWVCPFVSSDTVAYREARDQGLLIRTPDGKPYICEWWNGHSAALDMSNPSAVAWFDQQLQQLRAIGVDGFKFDAGDSLYYPADHVSHGHVTPDEQSRLWAQYGEKYELNEYRVTFGAGGYSLLQRLCDKEHSWGDKGIAALIPNSLLQGITGHPFCCPDMVGGGEYLNFLELESSGLDQELFCRHSEIACMMPTIQFSAAPWRILSSSHLEQILNHLRLRNRYAPQRQTAFDQAAQYGEPIIRYMEYQFPDQGLARVTDQFMLGDTLLIAPIYIKGATSRTVYVPKGQWLFENQPINSAGEIMLFSSTEDGPVILDMQRTKV